jgi:hypothetical protein
MQAYTVSSAEDRNPEERYRNSVKCSKWGALGVNKKKHNYMLWHVVL